MIELVVGGVYEGVGDRLWTITSVDDDTETLQWVTAVIEGGGSVTLPLRDAGKWFYTYVGMAADKVVILPEARERLQEALKTRDRLNLEVARLAKSVEQD